MGQFAGRNNADGFALDLNMYYEQQVPRRAGANGRISGLMIATGIHQAKERIEKHGRPFLECHPVMFSGIAGAFLSSQTKESPFSS